VIEEVQIPNSAQQADLVSAINSVDADTDAPLAEAVFQLYTYYMSRDTAQLPLGKDGVTKFPRYEYNTQSSGTGGNQTNQSNQWTADPVQYSCQKNFIMIITDGDSTKDHFAVVNDTPEAAGFADFKDKLIGDYNPDGETEELPNEVYTNSYSSRYLDDIARYMTEKDFRPDFDGDQTIDTYTIGFHASDAANGLLSKTAQVGNGLFFAVNDETALAQAIIDQLQNIIEKAQSFTAATVPASRTADGEQLYVSLFTPTSKTAYWDGHLRSYRLDGAGRILDKNGQCALDDASGNCFSGSFQPVEDRPPYWDASDEMPAPASRKLFTSVLRGALLDPKVVEFVHEAPLLLVPPANAVAAADLGVTFPPASIPLGSIATDAEEYTDEIVASVRGCSFGTGANGVACTLREGQLPDIFHSNPVVVGQPVLFESDPSYKTGFKGLVESRDRVIYAGSNGGFLHGFHAGTWDATDKKYDAGTGAELFGFMPWTARQNIQYKPFDKGNRDYYYVDGSPTVADAWFYTDWQTGTKQASGVEWHTVLLTGSRQGGQTYLALDVSDPSDCANPPAGSYPCYLWEFPREDDTSDVQEYVADTWGDPIVTKVRVTDGSTIMERWVAIVTGGYSPKGDPNDHASYDPDSLEGRAIMVVDLKTGEPLATRGFDDAGDCTNPASVVNSTPERQMCAAIPSTPAVYDADGDGYADVLYVGDLAGNLWKWVLKEPLKLNDATTPSDADANWPFRRLFSAPVYNDGSNDYYKSIYFPPAGTRKNGKIWLAFGTGERHDLLYMSDATTTDDNNRFYVIEETDLWEQASTPQAELGEADLLDLTSTNTCGDLSGKRGYYIVGEEGEKWVTNVEIFVGYVIVNSYIPQPSADPCEIGGVAYLWAFRVECGEGLFTDGSGGPLRNLDIGAGLPTDPRVTVGSGGDGTNRLIISKQGGDIINLEAPPGFPGSGMFYWREILE
jgi:type IV pilus assembly protein PilY1